MMFEKMGKTIQSLREVAYSVDPAVFDDLVALKTDWNATVSTGASFQTHKLVQVNPNRLKFRMTFSALLFYLIIILVGLGILLGAFFIGEVSFDIPTIIPFLLGLMFTSAGIYLLQNISNFAIFDKEIEAFWKGAIKNPSHIFDRRTIPDYTRLEEIYAIQLLTKYVNSNQDSYDSYELNLVLKDAERINVISHGDEESLREDAYTLSSFLNKPLWDAIV